MMVLAPATLAGCDSVSSAADVEIFADGLTNPRGIAFDDEGGLLVAEAGGGGRYTGRVTRVNPNGSRRTIADGLPFGRNPDGEDVGASSVAARGEEIFILTGQGREAPSQRVLRWTPERGLGGFSSLGVWFDPAGYPDPSQGRNPFDMAFAPDGWLWVVDSARNEVLRVAPNGSHFESVVLFESPDGSDPVPTGIAFGPDGLAYVSMFSANPHGRGSSWVVVVEADGSYRQAVSGLTMCIDVAFDALGRLHTLQFADSFEVGRPDLYELDSGAIYRASGSRLDLVADRLPYPVSMVFGPDDLTYLALGGAFLPEGAGGVGRLKIS